MVVSNQSVRARKSLPESHTPPPTIRVPTIAIFIIIVVIIIMIDFEQVFFLLAQTFFILRKKMFKVLLVTVIKGL